MKQSIAALFDLDGVIIDTEPQYDIFWRNIGEVYHLGIVDFERVIKGTTLPAIMSTYFSHLPPEEQARIEQANHDYESQLEIIPIAGAPEFLAELKQHHVKLGLVTSSSDKKLQSVFEKMFLKPYFDTIVSADRITHGKPNPMCYLLAAKDLDVPPERCFVFEDSFHGIQSGKDAGMKVVGLATTNSKASIANDVIAAIPDFTHFHLKDLLGLGDFG